MVAAPKQAKQVASKTTGPEASRSNKTSKTLAARLPKPDADQHSLVSEKIEEEKNGNLVSGGSCEHIDDDDDVVVSDDVCDY